MNRAEIEAELRKCYGVHWYDGRTDAELETMLEDFHTYPDGHVFYTTPIMTIGRKTQTQWRLIVYMDRSYGRCTRYEYRESRGWMDADNWPGYKLHESDAWPKTVAKLYYQNQDEIRAALGRSFSGLFTEKKAPEQLSLAV